MLRLLPRSTLFPYTTLFRSQKRLSFAFDFVVSDFFLPAWRNWQTRWTQNPVAARPCGFEPLRRQLFIAMLGGRCLAPGVGVSRSEEHTSELQSHSDLVCRLL